MKKIKYAVRTEYADIEKAVCLDLLGENGYELINTILIVNNEGREVIRYFFKLEYK